MIIPTPLWGGVKDKHYVSTQIAKREIKGRLITRSQLTSQIFKEVDYEDYRFYWEGLDGETGLY